MNKYLSKLDWEIRDLPPSYKAEIMNDYENHFKEGLLAGKTESGIVYELGDAELIAKNIIAEYYTEHPIEADGSEKGPVSFGKALDMIVNVLNLVIAVPFVFCIHLVVISLYISVFAMLAAPVFLLIKLFFPMLPITVGFNTDIIWLNVLICVALAAAGHIILRKFRKYGTAFFKWASGYYAKSFRFIDSKRNK